jgi:hypothetical protein
MAFKYRANEIKYLSLGSWSWLLDSTMSGTFSRRNKVGLMFVYVIHSGNTNTVECGMGLITSSLNNAPQGAK